MQNIEFHMRVAKTLQRLIELVETSNGPFHFQLSTMKIMTFWRVDPPKLDFALRSALKNPEDLIGRIGHLP